ncbi:hypothetical protein K1W54_26730 [Micromonospora sp. CPCC 205371]|nr:hypothetical protein [Micromonospora sp. CPCC 205371]
MPPPPDLLVIRLDELQEDIEEVQQVVAKAETRHERLKVLREAGASAADRLRTARKEAHDAALDAEGTEFHDALESLSVSLKDVAAQIRQINETVADFDRAMIHLKEAEDINNRCGQILDDVRDIRSKVRGGELSYADAWAAFDDLSDTRCRTLFSDYVDLLGGLTLRDTGLDDRISELTDALLDELGTELLALPARPADAAPVEGAPSLGSLIKLWFPEWTIWGVPLFGYDAGLAWVGRGTPLAAQLLAAEPAGSRGCLVADAYATYALGPAYASAAILLRMRTPAAGDPGASPAEAARAHVILRILRALGESGTFGAVVGIVEECWHEAVRQRGGQIEPANRDELDRFADRAVSTLDNVTTLRRFDSQLWDREARSVLDLLRIADSGGPPPETVRGLLNAAWAARLEKFDNRAYVNAIGTKAKRLWTPRHGGAGEKRPGSSIHPPRKPGYGTTFLPR